MYLYDVGARHPDEIYNYKSEKSFRSFMKENGLNPDKYNKPDGKGSHVKSGSASGSGSEGCYLTSACVMMMEENAMRKSFGAKAICYPMPVFIIGTYNADGAPNAMNAA